MKKNLVIWRAAALVVLCFALSGLARGDSCAVGLPGDACIIVAAFPGPAPVFVVPGDTWSWTFYPPFWSAEAIYPIWWWPNYLYPGDYWLGNIFVNAIFVGTLTLTPCDPWGGLCEYNIPWLFPDILVAGETITITQTNTLAPGELMTFAPADSTSGLCGTPEPGALVLLATGLLAMALVMRKRIVAGLRHAT